MEEPNVLHTQNIAQWGKAPNPQIYFETIDPYVIKLEKKHF